MPFNYTDYCLQCEGSLRETFIAGLRKNLSSYIAEAPLAEIVSGDRRIQLVARVVPNKGILYYEIVDGYQVKIANGDYARILDEYIQYVRDNVGQA